MKKPSPYLWCTISYMPECCGGSIVGGFSARSYGCTKESPCNDRDYTNCGICGKLDDIHTTPGNDRIHVPISYLLPGGTHYYDYTLLIGTTNQDQPSEAKLLASHGFVAIDHFININTNNTVTLWVRNFTDEQEEDRNERYEEEERYREEDDPDF